MVVSRSRRRASSLKAFIVLSLPLFAFGGCQWFLNETFVYDVAPPEAEPPPIGVEAEW